tara:strand:- start:240 stop:437 length:198 start_codon:yes stop_codon:yes gene_type:complete
MNTCNSINSIALGKLLKKYNLTPKNKQQAILLAQRKTATWSGLHRLARKLEFKQSLVDQQQQQQQ